MPREIVWVSLERAQFREYDEPELRRGQVRVRTEFGSPKHGTELAFLKGYGRHRGSYDRELGAFTMEPSPERDGPVPAGNLFVGTVTELGPGATRLSAGDRVLAYGPLRETQWPHEDACRVVPEGLSPRSAVCLDPADFALAAVRDGHLRVGDTVAVFGMGAIGLMAVQLARLSGAGPVIAVEPLANRRRAAEACGADLVLDPEACDAGRAIREATELRGADVVLEYSGSAAAIQAALRAAAFGGTVVAGAFPPPYRAGLDLGAEAHVNIPNVVFSRACSEPNRDHPRWDEGRIYATCWRLLCAGRLTGEPVVDPVVPFDDLAVELPRIASDPGSSIKLGVRF
jgi:threonine dehydrogenase-like Zn-dependent dehydrogenase